MMHVFDPHPSMSCTLPMLLGPFPALLEACMFTQLWITLVDNLKPAPN